MGDEGDVVGFYAYGESTPDSDVDLLVVKAIYRNLTAVATVIRKALRPLRHSVVVLFSNYARVTATSSRGSIKERRYSDSPQ